MQEILKQLLNYNFEFRALIKTSYLNSIYKEFEDLANDFHVYTYARQSLFYDLENRKKIIADKSEKLIEEMKDKVIRCDRAEIIKSMDEIANLESGNVHVKVAKELKKFCQEMDQKIKNSALETTTEKRATMVNEIIPALKELKLFPTDTSNKGIAFLYTLENCLILRIPNIFDLLTSRQPLVFISHTADTHVENDTSFDRSLGF